MPVAFNEQRFPDDIEYGAKGGASYSTSVAPLQSGHEQRNINWVHPRYRYEVSHAVKSQTQLDELTAFFHAHKGRAVGFRFKDWADYRAVGAIVGQGDGVITQFQLVKTYISGDLSYTRTISKPVAGTVDVYVDNVLQSSGVSVDVTTGLVTFDTAPAANVPIVADFEFDVPVRFDVDELQASLDAEGQYSWGNIELIELRV